MARLHHALRNVSFGVGLALILIIGLLFLLTRTGVGNRFALQRTLMLVESRIDGKIVVTGVSSASLLRGVKLRGISIVDADGRPFLEADSIQARYSLWGLLRNDIVLTRVRLWAPRVTVERLPGQEQVNASRIFRAAADRPAAHVPAEADSSSPEHQPGAGTAIADSSLALNPDSVQPPSQGRILLRRVLVTDGELEIRLPVEASQRGGRFRVEQSPDGGHVRRITFSDIQGDLPEVSIRESRRHGERFEVRSLSLVGHVLDRPFILSDFRGQVRRSGSAARFEADRLWLPGTETSGRGTVDWGAEEGVALEMDLEADVLELADFRWIEPRVPEGHGRMQLQVTDSGRESLWRATGVDLQVGGTHLQGTVGVGLGAELRLSGLDVSVTSADLSLLDPWLPRPFPVEGRVSGDLRLDGPIRALEVEGWMAHQLPALEAPSSFAEFSGILNLGRNLGVGDLRVRLSPLDYRIASMLRTGLNLEGSGSATVQASGRLRDGIQLSSSFVYQPDGLPASNVSIAGRVVAPEGESLVLQVDGDVTPLQLDALTRAFPEARLSGEVSGTFRLAGPLTDLEVRTRLDTSGGEVVAEGRLNALSPASGYSLLLETPRLDLSSMTSTVPLPTVLSGQAEASGTGLGLESLNAAGFLRLGPSTVGHLVIDTASMVLGARNGRLRVDSVLASTSLGELEASGELGLSLADSGGELRVGLTTPSIAGLRPFVLGDSVIAADTLSDLEREMLAFTGVDLDTLPVAEAVAVEGRARTEAVLRGSLQSFSVDGRAALEGVIFGTSSVRSGTLAFSAQELPTLGRSTRLELLADSLDILDRRFASGQARIEYDSPRGRAEVRLIRSAEEEVRAVTDGTWDGSDLRLELQELRARFEDLEWVLERPATIAWGRRGLQVEDFSVVRSGDERMEIRAGLTLPREGMADGRVYVSGLDLDRVGRLLQLDRELGGVFDTSMRISGSSSSPILEGGWSSRNLRYGALALSRAEGTVNVRGQLLTGTADGWKDDRMVVAARASLPVRVSLEDFTAGLREEEATLSIRLDSLPAAAVMGFFEGFEDVEGTLRGELTLAGSVHDLAPSGSLQLRDGAATLSALGVRHRSVQATASLTPDGIVQLEGEVRSRGTARVRGFMRVDSLSNPTFDLEVAATDFLAVGRRDVTGRVSGRVRLTGPYRRPFVSGALSVDEGTLFVEEVVRSAEVVDLSDPAFFSVVDTALVAVRPILARSQNPFLQNLRVDVDLTVGRGAWIRSRDMNVEMSGDLGVLFDRTNRDFVLVGTLEAVRGTYTAFGRQFQVRDGSVGFVGTPGLDPVLDIQALNRLRTPGGDNINITALVEGTLMTPRVSLTSDHEPPLAESDLVSYLIFGRPSALLAVGERNILESATGAGFTFLTGTFANQLASAVAEEIGFFDYLAVTTSQDVNLLDQERSAADILSTTQIEVGRYWTDQIFLSLLWRPFPSTTASRTQLPGIHLEWRFADHWTWEGFSEDRFFRNQIGLGDLSFVPARIFGLSVFWEGGY